MQRRTYLTLTGSVGLLAVAGCLSEEQSTPKENSEPNADSDSETDSGSSSNTSSDSDHDQSNDCRIETEIESEQLYDEWKTVDAGQAVTLRTDLETDDELEIQAVQTDDGARPLVRVEDPNGDLVLETDVFERIERNITAQQTGRYYIQFENTAAMTTGQWDLDLVLHQEIETEVCS
ncbi:uncharacterized protein Nmag_1771 [Natrialba magadii ATCC 43099]|uniref:Uncharacterized protein n=1 Tax=Natrialba magadii (strain ATCC 43099 / DSM 3394 / CCM 3739 / CIP 104546 / IAM 13178 / JCM 8861 / NBRC 102185 / NCIMB 2190 / MS3) TaxID=547559 RepID=D3SUT7_NATMM|nr:hypothetical protein [Natrialba magadii]ADD05345.1 uncharacterized protein Nmag_1771 [Natrialba magadii ATCC 43099]ELY29337.1 hypothetical protein C500_11485 [Natrialba magadii ATCC 43099]